MLYIRTGKPGHGKTLNTIKEVDERAFKQSRIVYFHNVNGLDTKKLSAQWFEFEDPEKWHELPANSIVVIDEAQGWFGTRDPRSRPPEFITAFETMRHNGFEVHLITQDPRYIDVHARRLCNSHVHYWRVMKSQQLIRFESEVVIERVDVMASFKDADKTRLRIDKKMFDVYTSSNADHHFKFKPSKKLIMSILIIALAIFLVFRVYMRYSSGTEEAKPESVIESGGSLLTSMLPNASGSLSEQPQTVEQYLASNVPRIPDLPASAPVYDQLTTPVTYPKLYCLSTSDPDLVARRDKKTVKNNISCQCYTQQATKFHTSFEFCIAASKDGHFDHALPDRQPLNDFQVDSHQVYQPQNTDSKGVRVTVIPHVKNGIVR